MLSTKDDERRVDSVLLQFTHVRHVLNDSRIKRMNDDFSTVFRIDSPSDQPDKAK